MSAEVLWVCKTTTKFQGFIKSAKIFIGKIIKQGGLINHMKKALLKLLKSHEECFIISEKTNNYILNEQL